MAAKTKLSNDERIKKFLETEDWSVLEGEPLYFGKRDGNLGGMWCKYVVPSCLLSCGISACFAPMQCCCPSTVYEKYDGVYLDQEAVWDWAAMNTCCCSIKRVQSNKIRLEDVMDTWTSSGCCDTTEFVVKSRITNTYSVGTGKDSSVHTAHSMLRCAWLADPETAYRCTELAVKLHRKQLMGGGAAMAAAAAAIQQMARGESSLTERLTRLEDLKKRGVLTDEDMAACKVAILQANPDPTVKLMEMADLYQKGMVSAEDLAGLKAKTLEALKA